MEVAVFVQERDEELMAIAREFTPRVYGFDKKIGELVATITVTGTAPPDRVHNLSPPRIPRPSLSVFLSQARVTLGCTLRPPLPVALSFSSKRILCVGVQQPSRWRAP